VEERLGVDGGFLQGADRFVQLRAAAGEGVAEAGEVLPDRLAGALVEHVEELVDVDRFRLGGGDRDRFAGLEPLRGAAGGDLQELEAEGRLRPHRDRRIDRQRFGVLVEAEREFRRHLAVFEVDRLHRLDDADANAADPHLVAFDQGVGVRHPRLEVVGGDEGEAVVGVVGEEDSDDDDEHGDCPDDDRAAGDAAESAAVPHGPRR
jgi:hypothetical protein